jgi:hypothetical protein
MSIGGIKLPQIVLPEELMVYLQKFDLMRTEIAGITTELRTTNSLLQRLVDAQEKSVEPDQRYMTREQQSEAFEHWSEAHD